MLAAPRRGACSVLKRFSFALGRYTCLLSCQWAAWNTSRSLCPPRLPFNQPWTNNPQFDEKAPRLPAQFGIWIELPNLLLQGRKVRGSDATLVLRVVLTTWWFSTIGITSNSCVHDYGNNLQIWSRFCSWREETRLLATISTSTMSLRCHLVLATCWVVAVWELSHSRNP